MRWLAILALVLAGPAAAAAYDLNGVSLGGDEQQVKKAFPSAYCKPLEWVSKAADRRCDDGKISVAGLSARVTVYLKTGSIQGIAVRFDSKDRDRIVGHLKSRWGPPAAEKTETIARKAKDGKDKEDRKVFKVNWEKGDERALLTAQSDRKRAQLDVWRGNFYDEIYKVR
jgi:hypothetical protein